MTHRFFIVCGLVVSSILCVAATAYLVAVGARVNTQTVPLSPAETYLSGGGLIVGALGLAVFAGLAHRPPKPAAGVAEIDGMPVDDLPVDDLPVDDLAADQAA